MARKFQPQMATGNDLLEGDVVYFTSTGEWSREIGDAALAVNAGGGGGPAEAGVGVPEPGGRRLSGRGGDRRSRARGAGAFPRGVPHPRALELSPAWPAGGAFRCMTTPISTATSCASRVAEFRDQVERRIDGVADRGGVPAAAAAERALPAAARLHAAGRHPLRHAERAQAAAARLYRRALGQGLRPLHHPAEHPVQLAEAARRARHPRGAGGRRDARDPDQRQLHPQRDRRPFRRRRRRRDRGSAPDGRADPAVVDRPSGVHLPAAQVQDRHHRRAERPGGDQDRTTSACRMRARRGRRARATRSASAAASAARR